jgi:hypothetical protein
VIVSEASRVKSDEEGGEERFLDPKSKTTFSFDHLRLVRWTTDSYSFVMCSILAYRKPPIRSPTNPRKSLNLSGMRRSSQNPPGLAYHKHAMQISARIRDRDVPLKPLPRRRLFRIRDTRLLDALHGPDRSQQI